MTFCLATFFWVALFAAIARFYKEGAALLIDFFMVAFTILLMGVAFSSILSARCGKAPLGTVAKAVFLPWVLMFAVVVALLRFLPGWKQPFANTFGYLFIQNPLVDGKGKLKNLFADTPAMEVIGKNPGLLMNEFNLTNFDAQVKTFQADLKSSSSVEAVAAFRRVVLMKEVVAEFAWHILAGSVALIASYNILMNEPCA
jgi:hypothetical protein